MSWKEGDAMYERVEFIGLPASSTPGSKTGTIPFTCRRPARSAICFNEQAWFIPAAADFNGEYCFPLTWT